MVRQKFLPVCLLPALCCLLTPANAQQGHADGVRWSTDVEGALQAASSAQAPVLMEFTASWCVYCKRMEQTTFTDPAVAAKINSQFVAIQVDADQHKDLVRELQVRGLPAILVIAPDLTIVERISGFQSPDVLLQKLSDLEQNPALMQAIPAATNAADTRTASPNRHREQSSAAQPAATAGIAMFDLAESAPSRTPLTAESVPRNAPAEMMPTIDLFAGLRPSTGRQPAAGAHDDPFLPISNTTVSGASTNATRQRAADVPVQDGPLQASSTPVEPKASFRGVCLVSAIEDREIVAGSTEFALVYRGHLLQFRSAEQKNRFARSPDKYWPMLDGMCGVTLAESGRRVYGDVQFAAVFRKRVWFFAGEEQLEMFLTDPAEMVEEALEHI